MCAVISIFSAAVSLNEFKNSEVIDGLDKRSQSKGMVGLHWKKSVSPRKVSAADRQINHCDWMLEKHEWWIVVSYKALLKLMWTVAKILSSFDFKDFRLGKINWTLNSCVDKRLHFYINGEHKNMVHAFEESCNAAVSSLFLQACWEQQR